MTAKRKIKEILSNHPRTHNVTLAKKFGVTTIYVQALRRELGLPNMGKAGRKLGGKNSKPKQLTLDLAAPKGTTKEQLNDFTHKITSGNQARKAAAAAGTSIDSILEQRGETYGNFMAGADTAINLKRVLHRRIADRGLSLFPDQLHALDMITAKLSRIVNGDYNHVDSWKDIAGYAKLVADRLIGKSK